MQCQLVVQYMLFAVCFFCRRRTCRKEQRRAVMVWLAAVLAVLLSQVRVFTHANGSHILDAEIVPHSALSELVRSTSSCELWATWLADIVLVVCLTQRSMCRRRCPRGVAPVRCQDKLFLCVIVAVTFRIISSVCVIAIDGGCSRAASCAVAVISDSVLPFALWSVASVSLAVAWRAYEVGSNGRCFVYASAAALVCTALVRMQLLSGMPRKSSWWYHIASTRAGNALLLAVAPYFLLAQRHINHAQNAQPALCRGMRVCVIVAIVCSIVTAATRYARLAIALSIMCTLDRHRVRDEVKEICTLATRHWSPSLREVGRIALAGMVFSVASLVTASKTFCANVHMQAPTSIAEMCYFAFPALVANAQTASGLLMCPPQSPYFVPSAYAHELMCCDVLWRGVGAGPLQCSGHSTFEQAFAAGSACSLGRTFACQYRHVQPCQFEPQVRVTEHFLYSEVSEGLTNQRMALISGMALAVVLNRTFVLGDLRTGNRLMGGEHDIAFGTLYDVPELMRRLPRGLRVCEARRSESLSIASTSTFGAYLQQFGGKHSSAPWLTMQSYAKIRQFARVSDVMLHLERDVWKELPGMAGWSCRSVFCAEGAREYLALDRALLFARPIRQEAQNIVQQLRSRNPGARLSWLHLRIESDWASVKFAGCPFNNAKSIMQKLLSTVVNGSIGSGCATVPPTARDVLYVAGGVADAAFCRQASRVFRSVRTARDFKRVTRFLQQSSASALRELNMLAAAIDFHVGVLSDTHIACDCSTFSSEVVILRNIGRGGPSRSSWTWSGPAYPKGTRLRSFMCEQLHFPWGGITDGDKWSTDLRGLRYT